MNTIGIAKLRKTYGYRAHVDRVLTLKGYLKELPRLRGNPHKYEILKPLPGVEEFVATLKTIHTQAAESVIEEAYNDFELLQQEIEQWYDNMPENLQGSLLGETLDNTNTELQDLEKPDIPDAIQTLEVTYIPMGGDSRADRCADACGSLKAVIRACEKLIAVTEANVSEDQAREELEGVQELIDELQEDVDTAEALEFPAMM